jgi:hypothetical protein
MQSDRAGGLGLLSRPDRQVVAEPRAGLIMQQPDDPGQMTISPDEAERLLSGLVVSQRWFSLGPFVLGVFLGALTGVFIYHALLAEALGACQPH